MITWHRFLRPISFIMVLVCVLILPGCNWWQKSTWLSQVEHELAAKTDMQLEAQDTSDIPVIFELHKIDMESPQFSELIPSLSAQYAQFFTPLAVKLLKQHPDVLTTISDYKSFDPYFKRVGFANVDWSFIHEKIEEAQVKIFQTRELVLPKDTKGWIVTALNPETRELLGFLRFTVSSRDPYGSIQGHNIGFKPEAQRRGLGKLILSSLFKLVPQATRIYLRVLPSNTPACNAYHSYGFRQYTPQNKAAKTDEYEPYFLPLEYKADQSGILQKVAEKFKKNFVNGLLE